MSNTCGLNEDRHDIFYLDDIIQALYTVLATNRSIMCFNIHSWSWYDPNKMRSTKYLYLRETTLSSVSEYLKDTYKLQNSRPYIWVRFKCNILISCSTGGKHWHIVISKPTPSSNFHRFSKINDKLQDRVRQSPRFKMSLKVVTRYMVALHSVRCWDHCGKIVQCSRPSQQLMYSKLIAGQLWTKHALICPR